MVIDVMTAGREGRISLLRLDPCHFPQEPLVGIDGRRDAAGDGCKLTDLGLVERIEDEAANLLDMPWGGRYHLLPARLGQ